MPVNGMKLNRERQMGTSMRSTGTAAHALHLE